MSQKPHVICIPSPTQSHIKAMLKLSKLLHHNGFYVTFVNSDYNHRRFLQSGGPNSLNGLPDFNFDEIPDGLPPSDADVTQDVATLCNAVMNNLLAPFCDLIVRLNEKTLDSPPVSCIVSDVFMAFTSTAGERFGIPVVLFSSVSACGFMGFKQYSALRHKGITPFKDESWFTNGYLETIIDWIPGMTPIKLKQLPTYVQTTDPKDVMLEFCIDATERAIKGSGLVIHTYEQLESDILNALSTTYPQVYSIGPLDLLLKQIPQGPLESIGYSLWKEDTECFQWLNSKPPNSVVYVNFGSLTVMTLSQLVEFGWGLANSNNFFLWVIRPDLVTGASSVLPPELESVIEKRGFISSWCPQEEVLNHDSVGVFLTHCGWSSTMESLAAGVPMICWPSFGDQQTNCKYCCEDWGVGKEIDSNVKRDEVEKLVRILMEEDEGKKIKSKSMELKRLAEEATGLAGSSTLNLRKLINLLLGQRCLI